MTEMNITNLAADRYQVEVRAPFIHGVVSASQFLAIASEGTSPMAAASKFSGSWTPSSWLHNNS